jgi:phage shock protein PspC (stress-responsive transcriptional regulator)
LYRSTTDRSLSGVCGGLAAWLGLDPSLVRIVWVLLAIMSGGIFVVLYVVMAIVVPDAPPGWVPRGRKQPREQPPSWGPGYGPGWGGGAPGGAWTGAQGWQGGAGAPGAPPAAAPTQGRTPPDGAPTSWPEDAYRAPRAAWEGTFPTQRAGVVAGVALVVLGVWFLVKDYMPINWDLVWPVVVIALGGVLIAGAIRRGH